MSSLRTGPPQFTTAQRKADVDAIIEAAKSLPSVSMIEAHVRLVKNLLGADLDAWKVGGSDENRSGMATDARGDQTDPPPDVTQSPTALGAVPLTALAFVEGSASDVGDSSDESYSG